MQRPMLVLACMLASATAATAAPYSIVVPAGWKDTTLASPDVDATKLERGVHGQRRDA